MNKTMQDVLIAPSIEPVQTLILPLRSQRLVSQVMVEEIVTTETYREGALSQVLEYQQVEQSSLAEQVALLHHAFVWTLHSVLCWAQIVESLEKALPTHPKQQVLWARLLSRQQSLCKAGSLLLEQCLQSHLLMLEQEQLPDLPLSLEALTRQIGGLSRFALTAQRARALGACFSGLADERIALEHWLTKPCRATMYEAVEWYGQACLSWHTATLSWAELQYNTGTMMLSGNPQALQASLSCLQQTHRLWQTLTHQIETVYTGYQPTKSSEGRREQKQGTG